MKTSEMPMGSQMQMSSLPDFLVRTLATPVNAPEYPESAQDCSGNWCEPFAWLDRSSQLPKTWPHSLPDEARTSGRLTDAYVAGLLDGEGCLTIVRAYKGNAMASRIDIGMSDRALHVLKMLKDQFGGSVHLCRRPSAKWEGAHKWSIQGPPCAAVLKQVGGFMILKQHLARLLISLEAMKESLPRMPNGSAQWTAEAIDASQQFKQAIHEINRKGPSENPVRHADGVWRTWQRSLIDPTGWEPFSEAWPRSGMTRNGIAYRLNTLAPITREIGSISSPTLTRRDARTLKGGQDRPNRTGGKSLLQTLLDEGFTDGRINPRWAEWYMGFPQTWTQLAPLVIPSLRASSNSSAKRSSPRSKERSK